MQKQQLNPFQILLKEEDSPIWDILYEEIPLRDISSTILPPTTERKGLSSSKSLEDLFRRPGILKYPHVVQSSDGQKIVINRNLQD